MGISRVMHLNAPSVTINAQCARRMRIGLSLVTGVYPALSLLDHSALSVLLDSFGVILLPYAQDAPYQVA